MIVYLEVKYEDVGGVRLGVKELCNFRIVNDVNSFVDLLSKGYSYEDVGDVSKWFIDLNKIGINTFTDDVVKYIDKNIRRLKMDRL